MFNKRIKGLVSMVIATGVIFTSGARMVSASEIPSLVPPAQTVETNNINGWPKASNIVCDTACLMDADSGTILYNKGMHQRMYPASTTKVMTALVALEHSGLNEIVTATNAGTAEVTWDSSNLGILAGEQFTMEDCLYAVLMKSANDFSSQVAEYVGGSVDNFVDMMNQRAAEIGCKDTHFTNAHGMPDANHYTTAYDLVLIMREAIQDENFRKITGAQSYTIPATAQSEERYISSHNALIMPGDYYYEACLGGKTGFTDNSMYTFVSFAEKNGRTLIAAVMHGDTHPDVLADSIKLFDYGFDNFQNIVMDEGHDVYSGGTVTIPVNAVNSDVVMTEGESFETDFGTMVSENYTYHDYPVGYAEITQTSFDAKTETPTPTETPEPTETQPEPEEDHISREDIENLDPDLSPLNRDEWVTVPHIVMGILIFLIFLGFILIVATVVKKSRAKKKKKAAKKNDLRKGKKSKKIKNKKKKK